MNIWSLLLPFKWFIIGVGEVFRGFVSLVNWILSFLGSLFKYLIEGIIVVSRGIGFIFSDFIFKYLVMGVKWLGLTIVAGLRLLFHGLKALALGLFKVIAIIFKYIYKGFIFILKWIGICLKKIFEYLGKALVFVLKYAALGLKNLFIYFYKAIFYILKYLFVGIKYFFIYLYKVISTLLKYLFIAIKTALIYIGKALKYFFVNIVYRYLGVFINAIGRGLLAFAKFLLKVPVYIFKGLRFVLIKLGKGLKFVGIKLGKGLKFIGTKIGQGIVFGLRKLGQAIAYPFVYLHNNFGKMISSSATKAKEKSQETMKFIIGIPIKIKDKAVNWFNNLSFVKDVRNRREMKRQALMIDFDAEDSARSDKKITYRFIARNADGKIEKGKLGAFSKLDVHSYLLSEGYEVYEIEPLKGLNIDIGGGPHKINMSELVFFLTQLSTYIKSGIPLVESIKILSKQTRKSNTKHLYKSLVYDLTMGDSFSEALEKQGASFPRLLVNMVKSSELAGNLSETLDDMAEYYTTVMTTRKQMKAALTYPTVIMVFAVSVLVFILTFVIPSFVQMYKDADAEVPALTTAVINISDFLVANFVWLLVGLFAFLAAIYFMYKNVKVFRLLVQWTLMHMPIIGKIMIYNEVTMFAKTFASLWNHNVFITSSMEILSKITDNEIYKMLIFDAITNVARGESVSASFKNHWAFPIVAYEMLVTGERTGQPGPMMDRVASFYQEEHRNAVNQVKAFIEPALIIFLAVVVGTILLSVVLPMFNIYGEIGLEQA